MKETTPETEIRSLQPRWIFAYAVPLWIFFGVMLLDYLKENWIPNWIVLVIAIVMLLYTLVFIVFFTVVEIPKLPSLRAFAFKPYWFWYLLIASVILIVTSWGIVLFAYSLGSVSIAISTTTLSFVGCVIGLKKALQ